MVNNFLVVQCCSWWMQVSIGYPILRPWTSAGTGNQRGRTPASGIVLSPTVSREAARFPKFHRCSDVADISVNYKNQDGGWRLDSCGEGMWFWVGFSAPWSCEGIRFLEQTYVKVCNKVIDSNGHPIVSNDASGMNDVQQVAMCFSGALTPWVYETEFRCSLVRTYM